jgi:hypothetical protein
MKRGFRDVNVFDACYIPKPSGRNWMTEVVIGEIKVVKFCEILVFKELVCT